MFEILNGLGLKVMALSKMIWNPILYALLVPAFQPLPVPSGQFSIGCTSSLHIDNSRTNAPFDELSPRELMLHWWYPIQQPAKNTPPWNYMQENVKLFEGMLATHFHLPKKFVRDLLQIKTHSYDVDPQNTTPIPVIIISHGLGGFGESQSYIAENLASHGYLVVGIDHTNFSTVSTFPDGRVIWSDASLTSPNATTVDALLQYYSQMFTIPQRDISFVINELVRVNSDPQSIWYNKIDLKNIGFVGHSMGAMAGTEAARNDSRIKALVNLDGWLPGFNSTAPLNIPTIVMLADKSKLKLMLGTDIFKNFTVKKFEKYYDQVKTEVTQFCKKNPYAQVKVVTGASHLAFCDFLLIKWPFTEWVPSRHANWFHHENAYPIIRDVNGTIRKFFDRYLGR